MNEMLEVVHRRPTNLLSYHEVIKDEPYHGKLKRLNITILETSRLRGDLIRVFRINVRGLKKLLRYPLLRG